MVGVSPNHWKQIQHVQVDEWKWRRLRFELDFVEAGLRMPDKAIVPLDRIERHIFLIRGEKVMLDSDLAEMYGVDTRTLNQAVRRNRDRFPSDFMFQLRSDEVENLRSQFVISSLHGGRRYRPYAFTEQGVAMLSSVLRSKRAIQVNVQIMRTFVRLRQLISSHADLARKLEELEKKYDSQFKSIFDAIRALMSDPEPPRSRKFGFQRR